MTRLRQGFGEPGLGRRVLAAITILLFPMAVVAQQRAARPTPAPAGTGEITGVVWSADQTPQPLRRVIVSITGGNLDGMRSVLTDDRGTFTFGRLAAGTFTITAKKPAYLPAAYGSMKPGRPGAPIVLAAGQRAAIAVTMFKGAVIAGTVHDSSGLPIGGVTVSATDARNPGGAATPGSLPTVSTVTDDRGAFRLFGLMPGDYLIGASPGSAGDGAIGARSPAEMDALLSTLAQRQKGVTTAGAAAPPPPAIPLPASVSWAPIYFPGTAWHSEAASIKVAPGDEREGVNFEVSHVRVASITGTVAGDVANLAGVQLSLILGGPRVSGPAGTQGIASTPPNARGEFRFANMPPGQYRIVARARRGETEADATSPGVRSFSSSSGGGAGGGGVTALPPPPLGGPPAPNVENLFAVADIDVRGQDVSGVNMVLQPGGTLSGRVVFDASTAPVPKDLSAVRVLLAVPGGTYTSTSGTTRVGNSLSSLQPVMLGPDGTFTIIGIGPDQYALTCRLPADQVKVWKLRSAIVDGRDLLDSLVEGPSVHLTGVTVTLSDRTTELTGTLQSASGQATADYYLIAFSTDRSQWRAGSRRSLSARPGTDGRFTFADLPAGEYFVAALTDLDPLEWQTPAFLEQIAPIATRLTVAEGERKVQDLRIK